MLSIQIHTKSLKIGYSTSKCPYLPAIRNGVVPYVRLIDATRLLDTLCS